MLSKEPCVWPNVRIEDSLVLPPSQKDFDIASTSIESPDLLVKLLAPSMVVHLNSLEQKHIREHGIELSKIMKTKFVVETKQGVLDISISTVETKE